MTLLTGCYLVGYRFGGSEDLRTQFEVAEDPCAVSQFGIKDITIA